MNSLVQLTIDAHGGFERWRRFEYVTAHLRNGGVLWALKHQQGVLDDVRVRVALRKERTSRLDRCGYRDQRMEPSRGSGRSSRLRRARSWAYVWLLRACTLIVTR